METKVVRETDTAHTAREYTNARRAVLWRKISSVLESGVERRCTKTRLPLHAAIGLSMSDMRSKGFLMSSLFFWRGITEVDRAQVHRRL